MFSAPVGTPGNALLNWGTDSATELISYAWNYRSAAMNLVAFRERQGVCALDNGALPILFLYRHSFELYLKALVYYAAILSIDKQELVDALPRLWREHSLERLAEMSQPVIDESSGRWLASSGELRTKILALARELDRVDSGSYSFRYPVTAKGAPALPSHYFTNIFVFSEAVETVLDDVAQFCASIEREHMQTSKQMKLALHGLHGTAT